MTRRRTILRSGDLVHARVNGEVLALKVVEGPKKPGKPVLACPTKGKYKQYILQAEDILDVHWMQPERGEIFVRDVTPLALWLEAKDYQSTRATGVPAGRLARLA